MSDQSDSENDENLEVMNQWLDFFADAGIPPSDAAQESTSNMLRPKLRFIISVS